MMNAATSWNASNELTRKWKALRSRAIGLAADVRIPTREVSVFARDRRERPLVALVGLVKAGKSRFVELLVGDRVGVVAAKEHSSHPIVLSFGPEPLYALQFSNGTEAQVARQEFEHRLSFDDDARRDDSVRNGIVQLPVKLLESIEFVDLPGLGGRRAQEIDEETLRFAAKCPLVFVLASRLKRQVLETVVPLARAGVSIVFIRTKSDKELRGAAPEEIRLQRLAESDELARHGVIAPIIAVTSEAAIPDLSVLHVPDLADHVQYIIHYYDISTICSRIAKHDVNTKLVVELHRQAAGLLCYCIGDIEQARHQANAIESPQGNSLAFLRQTAVTPWRAR